MFIAKPSEEDFEALRDFMNASEMMLDRYNFERRYGSLEQANEDDEDLKLYKRCRRDAARELSMAEDDVDERIVAFEFLQARYNAIPPSGDGRIITGCDAMISSVFDPQKSHIALLPGFDYLHVANEQ